MLQVYNPHIPNIDGLISDTNTLRIQYERIQKQYVGVAIEGIDIWYMAHVTWGLFQSNLHTFGSIEFIVCGLEPLKAINKMKNQERNGQIRSQSVPRNEPQLGCPF